jgi:hypothetical protein
MDQDDEDNHHDNPLLQPKAKLTSGGFRLLSSTWGRAKLDKAVKCLNSLPSTMAPFRPIITIHQP